MKDCTFKKNEFIEILFYSRMGIINFAPSDKVRDWFEMLVSLELDISKNVGSDTIIKISQ